MAITPRPDNNNSDDTCTYQGQGGAKNGIRKSQSNTDNKAAIYSDTEVDNYRSFIPFVNNEVDNITEKRRKLISKLKTQPVNKLTD